MRPPKSEIATSITRDFLTRSFAPGETIAILIRHQAPGQTWQRIVPLERVLEPHYLGWLAHENWAGANIHVGANPLRSHSRKRTKDSIARVRHLYLDLDQEARTFKECRFITIYKSYIVQLALEMSCFANEYC